MFNLLRIFSVVSLVCVAGTAHAIDLVGSADVNVTSDTAAAAKTRAFDSARRQIIASALGKYTIGDQLSSAIKGASASDLMNLVASSEIGGEKLSDTTYSANITMMLDDGAVRAWLAQNNVQNWLPVDGAGDVVTVIISASDIFGGWADLNAIARDVKTQLSTRNIQGNQITAQLPAGRSSMFLSAVRAAGWRTSGGDGVTQIWR